MVGTPPARRVIRLFPDYGRDWPLWENTTSTWDVGYTTDPRSYGLSDALSDQIAAWNAHWESHFRPLEGWDSDEARESWRIDGELIVGKLRDEVSSFADVT